MEPIYVRQTFEPGHCVNAICWFHEALRDAEKSVGATFFRYSWRDEGPLGLLIEGWASYPGEQGAQRWSFATEVTE